MQRLRAAFGDEAPSQKTVYSWYNGFKSFKEFRSAMSYVKVEQFLQLPKKTYPQFET